MRWTSYFSEVVCISIHPERFRGLRFWGVFFGTVKSFSKRFSVIRVFLNNSGQFMFPLYMVIHGKINKPLLKFEKKPLKEDL